MKPTDKKLIESTKAHEGFRAHPYRDIVGKLTIGYGLNLEAGITEEEASACLVIRVRTILVGLTLRYAWFDGLSDDRKRALVEMAYQLGGLSKFKNMLRALREGNYDKAAVEMLDSRWARQTPNRAEHCAALMRAG